jgi:hypothetical protein
LEQQIVLWRVAVLLVGGGTRHVLVPDAEHLGAKLTHNVPKQQKLL